jgi:hypothetical protein
MDRNKTYSAADIARYHNGGMTHAEMHALEKAALDDPFLADAIEGLKYSKDPVKEVAGLKTEINKRTENKKERGLLIPMGFKAIKIAALVIVLVGVAWIVYQLPFNSKNDIAVIQKNSSLPAANTNRPKDTVAEKINDSVPSQTNTFSQPFYYETVEVKTSEKHRNVIHNENKGNQITAEKPIQDNQNVSIITAEKASVASSAPQDEKKMQQPIAQTTKEIKGQVQQNNGQPLPYASVTVNGRANTITDDKGVFTVTSRDTTAVVSVSAAGYYNNTAKISNNDSNVIVLNEASPQLNEVVVAGINKPKTPSRKFIVESGELEPEEGWTQYNDYVASRLKPPTGKLKERGEVQLTFDVNEAGEPINITVENSHCSGCNEEAIRLLKEGPKWKTSKGKKGRIAFRF